tara:strand:- start:529 stop:1869 length:1341 start_codon:yes stop_codon:yes gene_type:complete
LKIELPQVGESVTEGIIGKWLVAVGDKVEKYDPLVEVVTDKVAMELPSPVSGTLREIIALEGETIPMGGIIADIESENGEATPTTAKENQLAPETHSQPGKEIGTTGILLKDVAPVGPTGSGGIIDSTSSEGDRDEGSRVIYSPAVMRLAEIHDVNLEIVTGTGRNGRVTKKDLQNFIDSGKTSLDSKNVDQDDKKSANTDSVPTEGTYSNVLGNDEEKITLSPVRKIIASNMVKSATLIPQAWSLVEVDVNGLVELRNKVKDDFQKREKVNLTYLPFVLKAVSESLKEIPLLNSSWNENSIILKHQINLGIAVAAPDGLVVPVIENADALSISGLAHKLDDLTTRAREGKLTVSDVQSGTFTVNNTGALGSIASQPLVNYPQAGIITTEAIVKRPVVVNDAIAIRSIMNICLSFDHRIIDGEQASGFNRSVKDRLESINLNTQIY